MNPWKISTLVFAALFAATVSLSLITDSAAGDDGNQGNMQSALEHLDQSEQQLEAAPDTSGHAVKALKLVRAAKVQVKKAIAAGVPDGE